MEIEWEKTVHNSVLTLVFPQSMAQTLKKCIERKRWFTTLSGIPSQLGIARYYKRQLVGTIGIRETNPLRLCAMTYPHIRFQENTKISLTSLWVKLVREDGVFMQ
jgi:hypothetical protein